MAVSRNIYVSDGVSKAFTVSTSIDSKSNVKVYYTVGEVDNVLLDNEYDILENIVITKEPIISGSTVTILVSSDGSGLELPPSKLDEIYDSIDNINITAQHINNVDVVADNIEPTNNVGSYIQDVINTSTIKDDIVTVSADRDIISAVNSNKSNIDNVADNKDNIDFVTSKMDVIDFAKNNMSTMENVRDNENNINNVSTNMDNINVVVQEKQHIETVSNNISDVSDMAKLYDRTVGKVASNVLLSGDVAIDNTAIVKNHAVVTYTGNGDTQEIETGISSVDFTQPNNGSGYYNKRVGRGFAVIADDAVDLIDSSNDTSSVDNWTAGNDAGLSSDGTTLSVNNNTTDYGYAYQEFIFSAGYYAISCNASGNAPVLKVFDEVDATLLTPIVIGSILHIIKIDDDNTTIVIRLECASSGDDDTATFSNLSILPLANNGEGSCVVNTSKVHIKGRSNTHHNIVEDGIRGKGNAIITNDTYAEAYNGSRISNFSPLTLGNEVNVNEDAETYVLYQTLYTHIKYGFTSHNKYYIEAYNPVTREGMIMYEGSGDAGHEIKHSMGVELDYWMSKSLMTDGVGWSGNTSKTQSGSVVLNLDRKSEYQNNRYTHNSKIWSINVNSSWENLNGSVHVIYYKCKSETFTIGTYIGTGKSGNKIPTYDVNGKPVKLRDVVIKRIDDSGAWVLYDTKRSGWLRLNTSDAEGSDYFSAHIGNFTISTTANDYNAKGGQYLYYGYIDTNANTTPDDSYFKRVTDGSNLNITNGVFSFTKGIDSKGFINDSTEVTETVDFTGVSDGIYWVGRKEDGSYIFSKNRPNIGLYEKQSVDDNRPIYDVSTGKWYETTGGNLVVNGDFSDGTIDGWSAHEDATLSVVDGMLKISGADTDYPRATSSEFLIESGSKYTVKIYQKGTTSNRAYIRATSNVDAPTEQYYELSYLPFNGNKTFITIAQYDLRYLHLMLGYDDNKEAYFDNIQVYKLEPTIGQELGAISWLKNPIQVQHGTPQAIVRH